jgi:predicted ATPase
VTGPLNESKLKSLPEMTDSTKKEAMAFLEQMLICSYQSQSIYFPLLACRMVRISVQYGWTKTSCVGKIFVRDILCSRLVLSSVGLHDGSFFLRVLQYRSRISCA